MDLQAHSWGSCIWLNLRGSWAQSLEEDICLGLAMEPASRTWNSFWYQAFWKRSK